MAYPGEKENVAYLQYVERVSTGDEPGPQLSKEEWRKKQQQTQAAAKSDLKIQKKQSQGTSALQIGGQQ